MKQQIKIWMLRLTATGLLIAALLLAIVLNPVLVYANKTVHNKYTIFHDKQIDQNFIIKLGDATRLVRTSELFSPTLKLDICLNDGSVYPALMQRIQGSAFAQGFYNKVVLMGNANYRENYVELNGYKWNLTQLLAHELTHCFQFEKYGFWKSNPVARIPVWKWEGYPEYVARQGRDQKDLFKNIERLADVENRDNNGWIQFPDSTGAVIPYYKSWLLVQYCMDIKKMTFAQVLKDTTAEETLRQQMMRWYKKAG